MSDPSPRTVPAVRRAGRVAGALGSLALLAALVAFLFGGTPHATVVTGVVLYVVGLAAGLFAGVLLWASWTEDGPPAGPEGRRGVAAAAVATLLVVACGVVSLGRALPGAGQLVLIGVTAVALAAAVLVAPARP